MKDLIKKMIMYVSKCIHTHTHDLWSVFCVLCWHQPGFRFCCKYARHIKYRTIMHPYMCTYMNTYIHACSRMHMQMYVQNCTHACICAYIGTYIHTYIKYTHIYKSYAADEKKGGNIRGAWHIKQKNKKTLKI